MNPVSKPRIVLYGIGQYGGYVARFAVEKGWPIVAAYNRAGPKIGQDLGRVIGLDRDIGVTVQDCDTASFDKLEADIGVVAQTNLLSVNFAAYERLMSAGLNVICHGAQSYYPHGCDPETADRIDALARARGVTFTGTGIWDMSRIWAGILVAGPCTEITSLFHSSITDCEGQTVNLEQARQVGIGMTVEEFEQQGMGLNPVAFSYKTIVELVLLKLGFDVTGSSVSVEPVVFDEAIPNPWSEQPIPAGICVGTRVVCETGTAQAVTGRAEIELRLFREGDVEHMFWSVDGKPRSRLRTEREDSAHATAACLFNRIPDVIAAAPGIALITAMGPVGTTALA